MARHRDKDKGDDSGSSDSRDPDGYGRHRRALLCSKCNGDGTIEVSIDGRDRTNATETKTCETCGGSGLV